MIMKTAIRKIFNKYCTQVNMDYNEYIVLKPDEFIKELVELFASQNPERIREVLQDHSTFNAKISSKSFIIDDEFDSIISDLCSGSQDETDKIIKDLSGEKIPNIKTITSTDYGQEKEQKSFDGMEYHNTCSFD